MLLFAIVFITLALLFYTVGVWAEKLQGTLKTWHLFVFWLGLACDVTGTQFMSMLVPETAERTLNFHMITGFTAIVLMFFHAIWATFVLIKKNENMKKSFHKFSFIVWLIWLIPYISGMIVGMSK